MKYATRSLAAHHAMKKQAYAFRCFMNDDGTWSYREELQTKPLQEAYNFAKKKDYVHHVEIENGNPILIVTCLKEELASEKIVFEMEPITPSLWDSHRNEISHVYGRKQATPRLRQDGTIKNSSSVASPTKLVWEIAEANQNLPRGDVIRMCIEAGVNEGTAKTQFQKWKRSKIN